MTEYTPWRTTWFPGTGQNNRGWYVNRYSTNARVRSVEWLKDVNGNPRRFNTEEEARAAIPGGRA